MGMRKFRKMVSFSHSAFVYGRDRCEKSIAARECFGLALKVHLSILIDRPVGIGPTPIETDIRLINTPFN